VSVGSSYYKSSFGSERENSHLDAMETLFMADHGRALSFTPIAGGEHNCLVQVQGCPYPKQARHDLVTNA